MSAMVSNGVLRLEGVCSVEDAEMIHSLLQEGVSAVDLTGCIHLHTACFQLLLAVRLPVQGKPANRAMERWLLPLLGGLDLATA